MHENTKSKLVWTALLASTLCSVSLCAACGSKEEPAASAAVAEATPSPAAAAPVAAAPVAAAPDAEAKERVDDPTFALTVRPAGSYKAGSLGNLVIELESRGEYHINQDYPTKITVAPATGLSVPKATLAKADAAVFEERKAKFEVPFMAEAAGSYRVLAKVAFAVCTEQTCVPDERNLALAINVE
jgi:hypothetical protein